MPVYKLTRGGVKTPVLAGGRVVPLVVPRARGWLRHAVRPRGKGICFHAMGSGAYFLRKRFCWSLRMAGHGARPAPSL